MEGFYMSTNDFVSSNGLERKATKFFGKNWEAEDDTHQIQDLLDYISPNVFFVQFIPGIKHEHDIQVIRLNTQNTVVCIDVEYHDSRRVCERIEGDYIQDFDNHHDIKDVPAEFVRTYSLSDFMDACNDQEFNLENYFITFVAT